MLGFKSRYHLDASTAALHRKLDHLIRNQESIMSAIDDLKTILDTMHQSIADSIAQQNVTLQRIADANAANDSAAVADLVRRAIQDNTDLTAETAKSKAATADVAAAPAEPPTPPAA